MLLAPAAELVVISMGLSPAQPGASPHRCGPIQETAALSSRSLIIEAPPKTNFGRAHDR